MFGGGGRAPSAEPAKPAPTVEDPAVQEAVAEAIRRRKTGRGYRSTILSKNMLDENAPALKETLGS